MSESETVNDTVGEIHVLFRGEDRMEISSTLSLAELNLALDQVKGALLRGDLQAEGI